MRDVIIRGARAHFIGHINKHLANIEIYMNNTIGIGEHSDIVEAVQAELDKAAMHQDRWDMANKMLEK